MKSDIGPGRFQSAMSALHRACTELEKQGLAIVVQKHSNRPGIILTPEGHSVAEGI
ncbi:MAG: hypothetical protein JRI31_10515 [Deltaproteobacteria bacterium]|nr:hypothetical protein [Deltaproteobacteria bacterium]